MKTFVEVLLALVLLPIAGYLLYQNSDSLKDPLDGPEFPVEGIDTVRDRENWREVATEHGWLLSLEEGLAKSAESGLPLMVTIRCIP